MVIGQVRGQAGIWRSGGVRMHTWDYTGFRFYPLCANKLLILAVPLSAPLSSLERLNVTRAFSNEVKITVDEYCSEARVYKAMPTWILLHRLCSD